MAILRKQPWWDSRVVQSAAVGICMAVLLIALIGFPVAAVLTRGQSKPTAAKLARLTAWLASLGLLVGGIVLGSALQDPGEIVFGLPPGMRAGLGIWAAAAVLTAVLAGFTAAAWRRGWWQVAGRVSITVVCVAAPPPAACECWKRWGSRLLPPDR